MFSKVALFPLLVTFPFTGYVDISRSNCKVNINWLTPHYCLIWLFGRACHTLRKETFSNEIFAIYDLICKNLLRKNKGNATSFEKFYNFQRKLTKTGPNLQKFVLQNSVFGLMNQKTSSAKISFANNFFP